MKYILLLFLTLGVVDSLAQESCKCDEKLNSNIKTMYIHLDSMNPSIHRFLQKFIDSKAGNIYDTNIKKLVDKIDKNLQEINLSFPKSLSSCFTCSVNKELGDYKITLAVFREELDDIADSDSINTFDYSNVLSAYHYLVSARSALMEAIDNTQRNCGIITKMLKLENEVDNVKIKVDCVETDVGILQSNLSKTEKKLKRMSIANIILTTLVGVLVITTSN